MARRPAAKKKASSKNAPTRHSVRAAEPKSASTRQVINPARLAKPEVPLSNAVKVGNLVFVSGSTPSRPTRRSPRAISRRRCAVSWTT